MSSSINVYISGIVCRRWEKDDRESFRVMKGGRMVPLPGVVNRSMTHMEGSFGKRVL